MSERIYEVCVQVAPARLAEYRKWLQAHVAEILALPGFLDARLWQVEEPAEPDGWASLCVHYRLRDRAALDRYFVEHAPRLRADGLARFGGDFRAQRRVLAPF